MCQLGILPCSSSDEGKPQHKRLKTPEREKEVCVHHQITINYRTRGVSTQQIGKLQITDYSTVQYSCSTCLHECMYMYIHTTYISTGTVCTHTQYVTVVRVVETTSLTNKNTQDTKRRIFLKL